MNATNLYKQFLSSLRGRLLMGLLFALFTLTASAQAEYNLHICGTQVTSENCNDLSVINGVSGIVYFEPSTNTLTLDNATINFSTEPLEYKQPISGNMENLTILLKGSNYVKYALDGNSNIVIQNFGNLTITSSEGGELTLEKETDLDSYIYISSGYTLTIKDCSVIMNGSRANTWIWGVSAAGSTLTLDGASLKITDVCYPIKASAVNLQGGTYLAEPSNAVFDSSDKCYKVDGNEVQWNMKFKLMEPYVVYTPDNTTLTFYYDGLSSSREGTIYGLNENGDPAWRSDGTNASVTNVVFDPSFADARPTSTVSWFCDMYNLENISGLNYLNTSEVTNMMQMFAGQSKLTSLDLSGWNVENLGSALAMFAFGSSLKTIDLRGWKTTSLFNTAQMFYGCTSLTTIYVSEDWTNANIGNSGDMFYECTSLKGYQGTTYDADHVDAAYARLDGGPSNPGYLSEKPKEAYACYTPSNTTLTFYYDNQRSTRPGTTYDLSYWPGWHSDGTIANVTKAEFNSSFANARPTTTYAWFYGMENLESITGMEYLNTSEVTDMSWMFADCQKLASLDVSHFNTAKVTDMSYMFRGCRLLTSLDVSSFNTSKVTTMESMFADCQKLASLDVSNFNTSNVTNMNTMFWGCYALTSLDVSSINTAKVTDMALMFCSCRALTSLDVSSFNTAKVTTMNRMFDDCYALTSLDLSSFNTAQVTNMAWMFYYCSHLKTIYVGDGWSTAAVTNSDKMFIYCKALVGSQGTTYDADHVDAAYAHIDGGPSNPGYLSEKPKEAYACYTPSNTTLTFYYDNQRSTRPGTTYDLSYWPGWHSDGTIANVTKAEFNSSFANARPTTTYAWFYGMENLESITGMEYLNTSEVTDMSWMFADCQKLASLDVSHFNTAKVTDMSYMFRGCRLLTSLDVSSFNTSKVTTMESMFADCQKLASLDVSNFNTSNVTNMNTMFWGCYALTSLDVSSINTAKVTDMALMFCSCRALTSLDVSSFNTAKVTTMNRMFDDCYALTSLDLSSFNTAQVTNMAWMFYYCSHLKTIYVGDGWSTAAVTNSDKMFIYCKALVGGQGTTYDADHVDATYAHIDGGASNPGYFTEKAVLLLGDVNGDNKVDVADITALTNHLLGIGGSYNPDAADVDGSGTVTKADISALVQLVLRQ